MPLLQDGLLCLETTRRHERSAVEERKLFVLMSGGRRMFCLAPRLAPRLTSTVIRVVLTLGIMLCATLSLLAADEPMRPHITGISHIALYVHDLDKSRAFYKEFLGFAEPYSLTNKDGMVL